MTDGRPPIPNRLRLLADPAARSIDGGRILMGGVPVAVLRLSPRGAELVRGWFGGEPVDLAPAHQRLARRLLDIGVAHIVSSADPGPSPSGPSPSGPSPCGPSPSDSSRSAEDHRRSPSGRESKSVTVIVPVRDDPVGLRRTLDGVLESHDPERVVIDEIVVVDDGSTTAVEPDRRPGPPIKVIRNDRALGPGAARQRGLTGGTGELVLFIDADVTVDRATVTRLVELMTDPELVAVAPRIVSRPEDHLVGRYDARRSPLDLGPNRSLVEPGRVVSYLPTACLLVRRSHLDRVGGFDPDLRYGEDVDLVWRLGRLGPIRYEPSVSAVHGPRTGLRAMVGQRFAYGSTAGSLAVRHGDAVSPARTSPWTVLVTALVVSGHPLVAVVAWFGTAAALRRKLSFVPDALAESVVLTAKGHWHGGLSLVIAAVRAWLPPIAIAAALVPALRRPLALTVALGWARRLLDGTGRPVERAMDMTVGAIDDTAYCAGVWFGLARSRGNQGSGDDTDQKSAWGAIKPVLASGTGGTGSLDEPATPR